MHIENISMHIPGHEFREILKNTTWPEGMTLLDSRLHEKAIEFIVKMASYFGIPIRIRMELQSYEGSKILFKVTPPIRMSMARNLGLLLSEDNAHSYASHTLAEVDLVELSKGKLKSASIAELSISPESIHVTSENVTADWQGLCSLFLTGLNGSPIA